MIQSGVVGRAERSQIREFFQWARRRIRASAGEAAQCRGLPGGEPKPFPRRPMHRSTERLNAGEPVRIIAIGSSSPPGLWMLTPSATYPEVMRRELARLRPAARIEIINSGASVTL